MISIARGAVALVVLMAMLGAAGCGRKAMPEPRRTGSSSAISFGAR